MKIIFLDIDGVINSMNYMQYLHVSGKQNMDDNGQLFDPMCVFWLEYIINETGAKIVISSSWRHSGLVAMCNLWENRNLPGKIIDVTPSNKDSFRGKEIDAWIKSNRVESYVILDDDSDMLESQQENFIKIDGQMGLNIHSSRKAINILNK